MRSTAPRPKIVSVAIGLIVLNTVPMVIGAVRALTHVPQTKNAFGMAFEIVVPVLWLVVIYSLSTGHPWAWWIATIMLGNSVFTLLLGILMVGGGAMRLLVVAELAVDVAALVLLAKPSSRAWYKGRGESEAA